LSKEFFCFSLGAWVLFPWLYSFGTYGGGGVGAGASAWQGARTSGSSVEKQS